MVSLVRYVALLREMNVGGKALVKMADLKACVEGLGFDDVSTYIASGNVLFESGERDAAKLQTKIERAIEERFRLPVKAVVLDYVAYDRIVKAIPVGKLIGGAAYKELTVRNLNTTLKLQELLES